ncbi:uncharacterized protein SCHCODRAFT_02374838 [Schizophyllum commune H4-8]|uniref:uncharacterized protein n=1 Tax=Schizophyllum commune (strain H4-8 / FGSC 9210) TaxID=578458 RepID=UPI00215E04D8|nr:uncharacterized protein SCHCODRAFT_02374838 [Schizophyllum commune H4-8]KAI5889705.1 hypothetical protein SCHCODRAFT_02374838 [Schizophyllum commune H4-8]
MNSSRPLSPTRSDSQYRRCSLYASSCPKYSAGCIFFYPFTTFMTCTCCHTLRLCPACMYTYRLYTSLCLFSVAFCTSRCSTLPLRLLYQ